MSFFRRKKKATSKPSQPSPSSSSNVTVTSDEHDGGGISPPSSPQPVRELFDLTNDSKWDKASIRCRTHPQDARWKGGSWDSLPIHEACSYERAPLSLIRQLHEAYGEGIRTTNNNGWLPLHYACCGSSLEVIEYLHGQYRQGATKKDIHGETPIDKLQYNSKLSEEDKAKARDILSNPPGAPTTTPPRTQPTKPTAAGTATATTITSSNTTVTPSTPATDATTTTSGGSPGSPSSRTTSTSTSVDNTFNLGGEDVEDDVSRALDAVETAVASRAKARVDAARLEEEAAAAGEASKRANTVVEETGEAAKEARATVKEIETALRAARKVLDEAAARHASAKTNADATRGNAERLRREAEEARANVQRTDEAVENAVARMRDVRYRAYAPDRDRLKPFLESTGHGSPVEAVGLSLGYVKCCTNDFADEHRLGEGAFGVVYRGYDDVLQRRFAVKRIKYEIRTATDKNDVRATRKLLENELKVLNEFQHSHIARLYGYILTENLQDEQILVYELASRGSLDSFFQSEAKRSELSWQRRIRIALQLAGALMFLHEGGGKKEHICYHRDVKSANVCLRVDYSAVLIDCGLAKMIPQDESRAHGWSSSIRNGGLIGTIQYMCPPCIRLPVTEQTDIFAFGLVLLELYTGTLQRDDNQGFYDRYVSDVCGGLGNPSLLDGDVDEMAGMWKVDARKEYAGLALECIRTRPNDRPPIREVFCRLGDIAQAHCFLKPKEVEEIQLGKQASSYESVLNMVEEIRANQEETNAKLDVIGSGVQGANAKIDQVLGRIQWMTAALTSVVREESCPCPRLAIMVPSGACDRISLRSPSTWVSKDVHLYFLCACDLTPVQNPVVLSVTRNWLEKAMPFLKIGVFVLRAASAAGRASTGLPFDILPGLAGEGLNHLDTAYLSIVGSEWTGELESYCESLVSAGGSCCTEAAVTRGKALTDEAYEAVAKKACEENNKSWTREMELVESGRDGLVWIKRENKARWMKQLSNS